RGFGNLSYAGTAGLTPNSSAPAAQTELDQESQDKEPAAHKKNGKDKGAAFQDLPAVLWKDPGAIESLDLFNGIGGAENVPDPSTKFTFVERDKKGTQKKVIVKDEKGQEWIIKYGSEARPETAATRIVWAMGYHTDQDYFVPRVHIEGIKDDAVYVRF